MMKCYKNNRSIYSCEDVELTNFCDGTSNPFEFTGLPDNGGWVHIEKLRMMKKVIDAALRDAKKSGNLEYVDEADDQ